MLKQKTLQSVDEKLVGLLLLEMATSRRLLVKPVASKSSMPMKKRWVISLYTTTGSEKSSTPGKQGVECGDRRDRRTVFLIDAQRSVDAGNEGVRADGTI